MEKHLYTIAILHNNSEFDICEPNFSFDRIFHFVSNIVLFQICPACCSCIFRGFAMFNSLLKLLLAVVTQVSSLLSALCVCGVINAGFVSTNGSAAFPNRPMGEQI